MNEYGDINIENSFIKNIENINQIRECTFVDNLSKISMYTEKQKEIERVIEFHLDKIKKAIEYSTTFAAKHDKKSIIGYLGEKCYAGFSDESDYIIEMIIPKEKFDKENYDYKKYVFGEDINFVDQLCDRIIDIIITMGFTRYDVKPVKVMVKKQIQYETFFHGTKYERVNDHMEYGIVVKLFWQ